MKRLRLGVNVDHVATLRQARGTSYPSPIHAAALAEGAGADQITVHLRGDRRHIQDRDVRLLRETVETRLNLEMAATEEMVAIALEVGPEQVTLVPEKREELTTEGGLDVQGQQGALAEVVARLQGAGILTSLFIDPEPGQISASQAVGAPMIELHTGAWADAASEGEARRELARLIEGARLGAELGLVVAAGHGLNVHNVREISAIPEIEELNIGHALVARAVFVGFEAAVRELLALMERPWTQP